MRFIVLMLIAIYLLSAEVNVLNQFTTQDIEQEIKQKGVKEFVIKMAKGTNDQVASQGGYIQMDAFTNFISARANGETYISYIEISKPALIKMYAKDMNKEEAYVKRILENSHYIDIKNHVKTSIKKNINRMCSTRIYRILMQNGGKMQYLYNFSDGEMIDIHTITYDMCKK